MVCAAGRSSRLSHFYRPDEVRESELEPSDQSGRQTQPSAAGPQPAFPRELCLVRSATKMDGGPGNMDGYRGQSVTRRCREKLPARKAYQAGKPAWAMACWQNASKQTQSEGARDGKVPTLKFLIAEGETCIEPGCLPQPQIRASKDADAPAISPW